MISNAFKGAYQNEVSQQTQGINTITKGVKDFSSAVIGALGFTGALGDNIMATAAKHGLANKVGGVGGNIMLASMNERVNSITDSMVNDFMVSEDGNTKTEKAFDKVAGELKTSSEFETLDTVWNMLQKQAEKKRTENMLKKIKETRDELDRED